MFVLHIRRWVNLQGIVCAFYHGEPALFVPDPHRKNGQVIVLMALTGVFLHLQYNYLTLVPH